MEEKKNITSIAMIFGRADILYKEYFTYLDSQFFETKILQEIKELNEELLKYDRQIKLLNSAYSEEKDNNKKREIKNKKRCLFAKKSVTRKKIIRCEEDLTNLKKTGDFWFHK